MNANCTLEDAVKAMPVENALILADANENETGSEPQFTPAVIPAALPREPQITTGMNSASLPGEPHSITPGEPAITTVVNPSALKSSINHHSETPINPQKELLIIITSESNFLDEIQTLVENLTGSSLDISPFHPLRPCVNQIKYCVFNWVYPFSTKKAIIYLAKKNPLLSEHHLALLGD